MTIIIGSLRYRVELQARLRSPDEGGAGTVTWNAVASMFAQIQPVSGREIVSADGLTGRVTHDVSIRFNRDVAPGMRFTEGSRRFIVHAALDIDGRGRWLKCLCEERLA